MDKVTCETCFYREELRGETRNDCHRYPKPTRCWPHWWCGEYKERE